MSVSYIQDHVTLMPSVSILMVDTCVNVYWGSEEMGRIVQVPAIEHTIVTHTHSHSLTSIYVLLDE